MSEETGTDVSGTSTVTVETPTGTTTSSTTTDEATKIANEAQAAESAAVNEAGTVLNATDRAALAVEAEAPIVAAKVESLANTVDTEVKKAEESLNTIKQSSAATTVGTFIHTHIVQLETIIANLKVALLSHVKSNPVTPTVPPKS
jgi:hypothetical protein